MTGRIACGLARSVVICTTDASSTKKPPNPILWQFSTVTLHELTHSLKKFFLKKKNLDRFKYENKHLILS